jgi:hypothetical protein
MVRVVAEWVREDCEQEVVLKLSRKSMRLRILEELLHELEADVSVLSRDRALEIFILPTQGRLKQSSEVVKE